MASFCRRLHYIHLCGGPLCDCKCTALQTIHSDIGGVLILTFILFFYNLILRVLHPLDAGKVFSSILTREVSHGEIALMANGAPFCVTRMVRHSGVLLSRTGLMQSHTGSSHLEVWRLLIEIRMFLWSVDPRPARKERRSRLRMSCQLTTVQIF